MIMMLFVSCQTHDNYPSFYGEAMFEGMPYNEKYREYEENPFLKVSESPQSTFSIDADGASYANMRRFVYLGQRPPKSSVRTEEYVNYFTYDYPEPVPDENVSLSTEISACPWNTDHYIMRLGIKGKTVPAGELPRSNYVFLIDVSGSMDSPDKLGVLKTGFKQLVDELEPEDNVAIVVYAGQVGVLLPSTPATEVKKIKNAVDKLGAGGSTAGAAGITTAYEIAQENFIKGGNNRIILGTDGDFNVGIASVEELVKLIEEKRDSGIYLTVLGVGGGNLNDHMMEQIANNGNGNYEYIDNASEIQKVFVHEKSKFHTVAKDSKVQVTFNPDKVDSYRLIGYENRKLENEDFDDDKKDAGEIGAGQTITALYEVVLKKTDTEGQYAKFDFRYKMLGSDVSQSLSTDVKEMPVEFTSASESTRFAIAVAGFGLLMRESEYRGSLSMEMVREMAGSALTFDPHGYRKEFVEMINRLK
jgi:Ca-activated chloride channel family protein